MKLDPTNTGRARRGRLALLVATMALMLGVPAAASAVTVPGTEYLAVPIEIEETIDTPTPENQPDLTPDQLADRIRAAAAWHSTLSRGLYPAEPVRPLDGISVLPLEQVCDSFWQNEVMDKADQQVRSFGIEPREFKAVFYYFTLTNGHNCSFKGTTSGNRVLLNGRADLQVLTHEIGHRLGLSDAFSMTCTSASGVPVTLTGVLGGSCNPRHNRDVYSTMGDIDPMTYSAPELEQLGWNTGRVERISGATTSTVTKFLTSHETNLGGTTQALRIDDGAILWLEYRTPTGLDVPPPGTDLNGGLLMRVAQSSAVKPSLVTFAPDTSPEQFHHPEMRVGQTWENPRGNLSVTLNSISLLGASVTITQRTRLVPDLVGLKSTAARTAITTAGFAVGTTSSVFDCRNIGKVISQNPLQGTRLLPGRVVNFTFGVAPVRGCGSGPQQ